MKKGIRALLLLVSLSNLAVAWASNLDLIVIQHEKDHRKELNGMRAKVVSDWKKAKTYNGLIGLLDEEVPNDRAEKYKELFFSNRASELPKLSLAGDVFHITRSGKDPISIWLDPATNTFKVNDREIKIGKDVSFEEVIKQLESLNLVVFHKSVLPFVDEAHAALITALIVGGLLLAVADLFASAISKSNCKSKFMKFKQDNVTSLSKCMMELALVKNGQMSKEQSETYKLILKLEESSEENRSCRATVKKTFKSFDWFRFKTCVDDQKVGSACRGAEQLGECLMEFQAYEQHEAGETLISMEHDDAPYVRNDPRLKDAFMSYGACYGIDYRVLKGIAKAESSLNPNLKCDKKYAGLFQVSKEFCKGGRATYQSYISEEDCEANRCDVEVNTAVASHHLDKSFKRIQRKCPGATLEETILLSYVGHNNGPAVLAHVLKKGACDKADQVKAVRSFYDERGGEFRGVDADWGERKWRYGQKIADAVKSYGATQLRVPINNVLCPIHYGGMKNVPKNHFLEGRRYAEPESNYYDGSGDIEKESGTAR